VNRLRAQYIAQAVPIGMAATTRFGSLEAEALDGTELTELELDAAWGKAAARASEEALTKLRALPPPEADRARVKQVLSLMEQQTDVLRQLAAAASAGDTARVGMLHDKRVRLTHEKNGFVFRLALRWGVSAEALSGCPVSLPS